jgi:SAM-dependent methyltransferase
MTSRAVACSVLLLYVVAEPRCRPSSEPDRGHDRTGTRDTFAPDRDLPVYASAAQEQDLVDVRRRIVALVDARPGLVVADIGASYGYYIDAIAPALGEGGRYYATDIDPEVIAHLRRYSALVPNLVPRLARGPRDTALDDLETASVDVILMIDSVVFARPETPADEREDLDYLLRLARILKRTGRLVHRVAWLSQGHRPKDRVVDLFRAAGFTGPIDDVSVADHMPTRFRAPDGTIAARGFLLVFHKSR